MTFRVPNLTSLRPPTPSAAWLIPNLQLTTLAVAAVTQNPFVYSPYPNPPSPIPNADWLWTMQPLVLQTGVLTPSLLPFDFNRHPPAPIPSADWLWSLNGRQIEILNVLNPAFIPYDFSRHPAPPTPNSDWTWVNDGLLEYWTSLNPAFKPFNWHLYRAPNPPHPIEFTWTNLIPGPLTATVLQGPYDQNEEVVSYRHPPPPTPSADWTWMQVSNQYIANPIPAAALPPSPPYVPPTSYTVSFLYKVRRSRYVLTK